MILEIIIKNNIDPIKIHHWYNFLFKISFNEWKLIYFSGFIFSYMLIKILRGDDSSEWREVLLTFSFSLLSWFLPVVLIVIRIIDFFRLKRYKKVFKKVDLTNPPDWL